MKKEYYVLIVAIVILVILILVYTKQPREQIEILEKATITPDESVGSGFLEVETFPGDSEIFVDGVYKDKSPAILYSIPVGSHNLLIKKQGYDDFIVEVDIAAGKRTFVEIGLELEETVGVMEEEIEEVLEVIEEEEEISVKEIGSENFVNIGDTFVLYYDFSEGDFTILNNPTSDVFSKRYDTYLLFTRLNPVNIKVISKHINTITKEDCLGIVGQFEYLHSGQSLCVITKENQIVALGGEWEDTKNMDLSWKTFT